MAGSEQRHEGHLKRREHLAEEHGQIPTRAFVRATRSLQARESGQHEAWSNATCNSEPVLSAISRDPYCQGSAFKTIGSQ